MVFHFLRGQRYNSGTFGVFTHLHLPLKNILFIKGGQSVVDVLSWSIVFGCNIGNIGQNF